VNNQNVGVLKGAALTQPAPQPRHGVFKTTNCCSTRNVFDNVLLPLQICGFDHRESAKRVRAALDKVGLLKTRKIQSCLAVRRRAASLCIARAIVNRPAILLADEPTGNLDNAYAQEIMAIFKSFHQVGATLLISTHDDSLSATIRCAPDTQNMGSCSMRQIFAQQSAVLRTHGSACSPRH